MEFTSRSALTHCRKHHIHTEDSQINVWVLKSVKEETEHEKERVQEED